MIKYNMATILQIINADRNLHYFCRGLKQCGFEGELNEQGPFTLLSPVNLAFSRLKLPVEDLFKAEHNKKLSEILSWHIFLGKMFFSDFRHERKLKTMSGQEVTVILKDGNTYVNGAKILTHNRQGQNGIIHSVDAIYPTA